MSHCGRIGRVDKGEIKRGERSERKGIPILRTFSESNNSQSQTGHKANGLTWKRGEREREKERERERESERMGFHSPL